MAIQWIRKFYIERYDWRHNFNAGTDGVSGALVFSTGTTSTGSSGSVYFGSGSATG